MSPVNLSPIPGPGFLYFEGLRGLEITRRVDSWKKDEKSQDNPPATSDDA